MKRLALLGSAVLFLLNGRPALATPGEPHPPSEVSGVTVTAPPKPNPLVDPTSQFVRSHLPEGRTDQLARFRDPICVKVLGLPPEFDAFVAKRIVEMAAQVHAPVAAALDCTPNVHVIFSPSPQAQIDDIAKRRDILIGFHFPAQLKRLTTFSRPVGAWYVTRTVDQFGQSWLDVDDPRPYSPRDGGEKPSGRAGSRLESQLSAEVVHSLILADANKVAGEKIDAVADYIAVLALAKWQGLERCNAIPTILNLMADGCEARAPEAATNADLALLTGLYAVDPLELGSQQRAAIASQMRAAEAAPSTKAH